MIHKCDICKNEVNCHCIICDFYEPDLDYKADEKNDYKYFNDYPICVQQIARKKHDYLISSDDKFMPPMWSCVCGDDCYEDFLR